MTDSPLLLDPPPGLSPELARELAAYRARAGVVKGPRARRRGHDWVDERDRALHEAVAAHLRRDPTLLEVAAVNLNRFEPSAPPATRWAYREWRRLLRELPLDELLTLLTDAGERATALRQSSPFFGILPRGERDAIFARFEAL